MPELANFASLYLASTLREANFLYGTTKITIPLPDDLAEQIIALICEELKAPPGLLLDSLQS